jgi:hypothetical protein
VALEGLFVSLSSAVGGGYRRMGALRHCERSEAIHLSTKHSSKARARHHIEFESKRRSAGGSRLGHKRAQG